MLGLLQIFGKETVAGVDIGSRMIKIVQAEPGSRPGHFRITGAGVIPTPPESVRDGIVVDTEAVGQAIKELMQSSGISANGAIVAISGASVIVRHIKLPKMAESAARRSIRFEAGKYISTSVEDSMIEFDITGPVPNEPDKMGTMLVAAPNDMVESRLNALAAAGLEPIAVDIEAFALQRALLDLSPTQPGEGQTLALLDIGAVTTDVNIVTNGHFALTRNIAIGGDAFTNTLKSIVSMSEWAELEALKKQIDMSMLLTQEGTPEQIRMASLVQPVLDELLREVRRSMNYYQSQLSEAANSNLPAAIAASGSGDPVSKIIITGGSSKLAGIETYMNARLGVEVEAWNVFKNPAFDTSGIPAEFISENHGMLAICFGLALKEIAVQRGAHRQPALAAA
jgi:type IV pilus assembly protein PilM